MRLFVTLDVDSAVHVLQAVCHSFFNTLCLEHCNFKLRILVFSKLMIY